MQGKGMAKEKGMTNVQIPRTNEYPRINVQVVLNATESLDQVAQKTYWSLKLGPSLALGPWTLVFPPFPHPPLPRPTILSVANLLNLASIG
jgi:hypothetical protein